LLFELNTVLQNRGTEIELITTTSIVII